MIHATKELNASIAQAILEAKAKDTCTHCILRALLSHMIEALNTIRQPDDRLMTAVFVSDAILAPRPGMVEKLREDDLEALKQKIGADVANAQSPKPMKEDEIGYGNMAGSAGIGAKRHEPQDGNNDIGALFGALLLSTLLRPPRR